MRGFKEGLEGLFTRGRGRLARDSVRIVGYSTQIYRVELHLHSLVAMSHPIIPLRYTLGVGHQGGTGRPQRGATQERTEWPFLS